MAHLLRGKQAGVPNDLSTGIAPDVFVLDHVGDHPSTPPPRYVELPAANHAALRSATSASTRKSHR
jgi:hypothetical protein